MKKNNPAVKRILLLGAGKSTTSLIDYLIRQAVTHHWEIIIADSNYEQALLKAGSSIYASAVQINVSDDESRNALISNSDIVISMLPSRLHAKVAENCVLANRHLLTPSYMDDTILALASEIRRKNLIFLCEMGLDPGIDHMSAMEMITDIHNRGEKIRSFTSHCGGLVAPESDDNPWHYKISWNPRNVVLAGKSGAIFKLDGEIRKLPYPLLFNPHRTTEISGYGHFAWYPNRDSLSYMSKYGLEESATFIRTTLRHPDFCIGWNKIIELHLTDETYHFETSNLTYKMFYKAHLLQHKIPKSLIGKGTEKKMLEYLGLFEEDMINRGVCTAADILQIALEKKLALQQHDKDMVIMQHEIETEKNGALKKITRLLAVKGEDHLHTAMAKTVGLPLGIACSMILQDKINLRGLHIPILPEIYSPILKELEREGVTFTNPKG